MSVHPPIWNRPKALWRQARGAIQPGWRKACDDWAVGEIRAGLRAGERPIDGRATGLLPYRPDLLQRVGPAALRHPELRAILRAHPACALALITGFYEEAAPSLEPALAGSGEAVFSLLQWAGGHGRTLRQPEGFYRQTLVMDSYWGLRHAQRTRDAGLFADISAWCGDERRNYAAAAALFLIRHPREPVAPYREVVLANPFYAYVSLPRLASRGLKVGPEHVDRAKWACHFALSGLAARPDEFVPLVEDDPGWLIELAAGRGWLGAPGRRREILERIAAGPPRHPLRQPALCFLEEMAAPNPVRSREAGPPAATACIPARLASGQEAEARALEALGLPKNTEVWRPSPVQIESDEFRRIVGRPCFTARGLPRGTIVDSAGVGLAEIKSGTSVLNSTYQLRLQTYRSVVEEQPLSIYTERPVDIQFGQWLGPWGVKIESIPDPNP